MNKTPNAADFGTCSCEDINAISDETDRPCLDVPVDDEASVAASSFKKEADTGACAKEPHLLKK